MRKFIAVVLTLALVLGALPTSATAASVGPGQKLKDIAGSANEEAIQVAYDLGIVEGTPEGNYEPTKAVNRAEFAALITRALAIPKSALDSYTSTTFRDTSGYTWAVPYLAFCQQRGIMKGNGYGDAMPGRNISANEAVTMVLRAVGYTDNASVLVGQYPSNYVSLAQAQLLYSKVSEGIEIDKAAAAQIIYNALTVQLVQVDANALVTKLFDPKTDANGTRVDVPRCLLTAGLDCVSELERIITFNDAASSSINLTPYVGALATLYRSNATDKYVAVTEIKTQFLPGKFTFSNGKADKFKAIDGTEYTLSATDKNIINSAPTGGALQYNSAGITGVNGNYSGKIISTFINGNDGADSSWANYVRGASVGSSKIIIGAKINGKAITELWSVAVWDAQYQFLWESDSLNTAKDKINTIELPKDDFGDVDVNAFTLLGADTIDDIKVDNVVYLYKNSDNKVARVEVGTATQSGKITNKNDEDNELTIGGKVIGKSPYDNPHNDDMKINNEGTAYLDYYSRIYDFKLSEASKGTFAVIENLTTDAWNTAVAKVFDKDGKEVLYDIKSSLVEQTDKFNSVLNTVRPPGTSDVNPLLVGYSLSGGKLSNWSPGTQVTQTKSGTGTVYGHISASGGILSNFYGQSNSATIDSGVIVFIRDGSDFSLGSINDIKDKDLEKPFQYAKNDSGNIAALVVDTADAGASTAYIMVNRRYDDSRNDDNVDQVKGLLFSDGTSASDKTWGYDNDSLRTDLNGIANLSTLHPSYVQSTFPFPDMVEFRITDDGILKSPKLITGENRIDGTSVTGGVAGDGVQYASFSSGSGYTVGYYTDAAGTVEPVGFESTTVLYMKDGTNWKAYKPTKAQFEENGSDARYIFLRTDKDKGFDIIIKIK